ncbi:MAG: galactokinase [Bacteroidota bacterium]
MNYKYYEASFEKKYEGKPILVRSPGRINLIGEHTDYNLGFVMPAAVDKETVLALRANESNEVRITALDFEEEVSFSLNDIQSVTTPWAKYMAGVIDQLQQQGHKIEGFDCVFGGTIPIGSGMSSSAALECGTGYGLQLLFDLELTPIELVKSAQKAENDFVGVKCGIMDQFASVFSKAGHVIKLDCRDLSYSYYPAELGDYCLLLFDSQVKHSLASSEYNVRRQECNEAVEILNRKFGGVESLRDCTHDMLAQTISDMPGKVGDRAKFIFGEIERVTLAASALEKGDLRELGALMYETHTGLSKQYEVSCPELDLLVETTQSMPEVLGARMMGGGFGGCTINLIRKDSLEEVKERVINAYKTKFNIDPKVYEVNIAGGTSQVE